MFVATSQGTCEDPGTPQFGSRRVSDPNFRHTSTVEFSCHSGYTLRGRSVIICASNGLWNAQIPNCVPGNFDMVIMVMFIVLQWLFTAWQEDFLFVHLSPGVFLANC